MMTNNDENPWLKMTQDQEKRLRKYKESVGPLPPFWKIVVMSIIATAGICAVIVAVLIIALALGIES